jgi:photosystem II stability/assembly factor-like uncharacterized protein|nr:MAG TPA: Photosynthesis system II assembly factor YCF48 [Caudoviricetes sp.]
MNKYTQPKIEQTPIIDNLTSTDTDKVISVNQGKVLDDKISATVTSLSTSMVDTLDGNEVDKRPTVHTVKSALDKRADLTNNKIPLSQLPESLISNNDDGIDRLVAGSGIIVTNKKGTVCISKEPSPETINDNLTSIKKVKLPYTASYTDICYCDDLDLFIAIASNSNTIVKSSNGKDWTAITLPTSMNYTRVAYSSKLHKVFIVAENSNKFVVSNDGINFTICNTNLGETTDNYIGVVAIDNVGGSDSGMIIAITDSGAMVTSTDGINWVQSSLPTISNDAKYTTITYSNIQRKLVAVGTNGIIVESNTITNLNDPIEFTNKALSDTTIDMSDVCYNKDLDMYCAVISNNNSSDVVICKTSDSTWTKVSMGSGNIFVSKWNRIQYIPFYKMFIMVSASEDKCATSSDGSSWKIVRLPRSTNTTPKYTGIASSDVIGCICMTINNFDRIAVIGVDIPLVNISWQKYNLQSKSYWKKVCWSPELKKYCVVSSNLLSISSDGITWIQRSLPISSSSYGWDICWAPELMLFCISLRNSNRILTSPDGITLTERTLPSSADWENICWSPELRLFCAVSCGNNKAVTSPDGITWTERTLPSNDQWYGICWAPKLRMFCIIAYGSNKVLTSPDGITWTERTLPSSANWINICWSPKLQLFCTVACSTNKIATSPDGITWTERTLPSSADWISICWSPELRLFCIIDLKTKAAISSDGITWTQKSLPNIANDNNWRSICWSPEQEQFCMVSGNGIDVALTVPNYYN